MFSVTRTLQLKSLVSRGNIHSIVQTEPTLMWVKVVEIWDVWQFLHFWKDVVLYPLFTAWLRSEKYMWFMLSAADSLKKNCQKSKNQRNWWEEHLPAGLHTRSLLSKSRPLPGNLGTTWKCKVILEFVRKAEAPEAAEFLQKRLISEFFGFQWQNLAEILSPFKKYNNLRKVAVRAVSYTHLTLPTILLV